MTNCHTDELNFDELFSTNVLISAQNRGSLEIGIHVMNQAYQ
jgi:hypothetical protein